MQKTSISDLRKNALRQTGMTVEAINKLSKKQGMPAPVQKKIRNRRFNRSRPKKVKVDQHVEIIRPDERVLTSLMTRENITRLPLTHGCFNAGLAKMPESDNYICVYRPDEYSFTACFLDSNLRMRKGSQFHLLVPGSCADPRLIWTPDKRLLMIYSSNEEKTGLDCIRGSFIMDLNKSSSFHVAKPFRVSPPSKTRNKNWMPFVYDGKVYLIASIRPHIIYELPLDGSIAVQRYETNWIHPWFYEEFFRGNTNVVPLDDGTFLATFHTVVRFGQMHYYDNGCYVFDGKPPFKVLRCANRTYLRAEDAIEPHYRKKELITVAFPVGMVREGERVLISYGDNDSAVKILDTTLTDLLATTLQVY